MAKNDSTLFALQLPLPIDGQTYQIPLTKGYTTIIDAVDIDLADYKWFVRKNGYAQRQIKINGTRQRILLHRVILSRILGRDLEDGEFTDHINGNKGDNRRANLRVCNHDQNSRNRNINKNSKTGYKGVYQTPTHTWVAMLRFQNKNYCLGTFKSPEEAARKYDEAAKSLHGEFARLNFPDLRD